MTSKVWVFFSHQPSDAAPNFPSLRHLFGGLDHLLLATVDTSSGATVVAALCCRQGDGRDAALSRFLRAGESTLGENEPTVGIRRPWNSSQSKERLCRAGGGFVNLGLNGYGSARRLPTCVALRPFFFAAAVVIGFIMMRLVRAPRP